MKDSPRKQSGQSLSSPRPARTLLPAEEPLGLIVTLSHRPSNEFRGPQREWGVVGLVPAEGEGPGAAAGVGVQGLLPRRRAPACCTSWSAPKRAAPAGAPSSLPLRPNSGVSRLVRWGCTPSRSASSPTSSVPVLGPQPLSQSTLLLPAWQSGLPPLSRGA